MLKYLTLTIIVALVLFNVTIADCKESYRTYSPETVKFTGVLEKSLEQKLEALDLAYKIAKLRDKYFLLYESVNDLIETCEFVIAYENVSPNFNKYDVAAIIIKESKFYRKAFNKSDGGSGLTQAMPRYWKEELPWYRNPFNKAEAIRACYEILDHLHKRHKTKTLAFKRYNGSTHKSTLYARDVQKIRKEIVIA